MRIDWSHGATAPWFQMSILVTAEYTLNIFTHPCYFEKIPGEGTPSTGEKLKMLTLENRSVEIVFTIGDALERPAELSISVSSSSSPRIH